MEHRQFQPPYNGRLSLPIDLTPAPSQYSFSNAFNQTHNNSKQLMRARTLSHHQLSVQLQQLEKRQGKDRKPKTIHHFDEENRTAGSLRDIVFERQLQKDLTNHMKHLEKYQATLLDTEQQQLQYQTFKMAQQRQKSKTSTLHQKLSNFIKPQIPKNP